MQNKEPVASPPLQYHRLRQIDTATKTAVCGVCGPTAISPKRPGWQCVVVAERAALRQAAEPGRLPREQRFHILSDLDTTARTAVCSVCGPTEIRPRKPSWYCIEVKRREGRQRAKKYGQQPRKPAKHRLSDVDEEARTATCAWCGPCLVALHSKGWICCYLRDEYSEANRRKHGRTKAVWHRITEVDEFERTATCSVCGPTLVVRHSANWRCKNMLHRVGNTDYRNSKGDRCVWCGFKGHRVQLDVDHRDENFRNNDPSNLQTLCSNCHRLKTWLVRMKATPQKLVEYQVPKGIMPAHMEASAADEAEVA